MRIARCLSSLGWEKRDVWRDNKTCKIWQPKELQEESDF